jgi:hypothetical protein
MENRKYSGEIYVGTKLFLDLIKKFNKNYNNKDN